jgi:hypothetical protein
MSLRYEYGVMCRCSFGWESPGTAVIGCHAGNINLWHKWDTYGPEPIKVGLDAYEWNPFLGQLGYLRQYDSVLEGHSTSLGIPIVFLLTLLLPLSLGQRMSFRFPLWSWFA